MPVLNYNESACVERDSNGNAVAVPCPDVAGGLPTDVTPAPVPAPAPVPPPVPVPCPTPQPNFVNEMLEKQRLRDEQERCRREAEFNQKYPPGSSLKPPCYLPGVPTPGVDVPNGCSSLPGSLDSEQLPWRPMVGCMDDVYLKMIEQEKRRICEQEEQAKKCLYEREMKHFGLPNDCATVCTYPGRPGRGVGPLECIPNPYFLPGGAPTTGSVDGGRHVNPLYVRDVDQDGCFFKYPVDSLIDTRCSFARHLWTDKEVKCDRRVKGDYQVQVDAGQQPVWAYDMTGRQGCDPNKFYPLTRYPNEPGGGQMAQPGLQYPLRCLPDFNGPNVWGVDMNPQRPKVCLPVPVSEPLKCLPGFDVSKPYPLKCLPGFEGVDITLPVSSAHKPDDTKPMPCMPVTCGGAAGGGGVPVKGVVKVCTNSVQTVVSGANVKPGESSTQINQKENCEEWEESVWLARQACIDACNDKYKPIDPSVPVPGPDPGPDPKPPEVNCSKESTAFNDCLALHNIKWDDGTCTWAEHPCMPELARYQECIESTWTDPWCKPPPKEEPKDPEPVNPIPCFDASTMSEGHIVGGVCVPDVPTTVVPPYECKPPVVTPPCELVVDPLPCYDEITGLYGSMVDGVCVPNVPEPVPGPGPGPGPVPGPGPGPDENKKTVCKTVTTNPDGSVSVITEYVEEEVTVPSAVGSKKTICKTVTTNPDGSVSVYTEELIVPDSVVSGGSKKVCTTTVTNPDGSTSTSVEEVTVPSSAVRPTTTTKCEKVTTVVNPDGSVTNSYEEITEPGSTGCPGAGATCGGGGGGTTSATCGGGGGGVAPPPKDDCMERCVNFREMMKADGCGGTVVCRKRAGLKCGGCDDAGCSCKRRRRRRRRRDDDVPEGCVLVREC